MSKTKKSTETIAYAILSTKNNDAVSNLKYDAFSILKCKSLKTSAVEKKSNNDYLSSRSKVWQLKHSKNIREFSSADRILSRLKISPYALLTGAAYAAAAAMKDGNIYFNFSDNSDSGNACANDRVILYAEIKSNNLMIIDSDAGVRSDCEAILNMNGLNNCIAETYIAFISECGHFFSYRIYAGRIYL